MAQATQVASERRLRMPVYTIEECMNCKVKTKRPFQTGDYVYKLGGECTQCKGQNRIIMVYAEPLKPS
jgi:hypothetical protein